MTNGAWENRSCVCTSNTSGTKRQRKLNPGTDGYLNWCFGFCPTGCHVLSRYFFSPFLSVFSCFLLFCSSSSSSSSPPPPSSFLGGGGGAGRGACDISFFRFRTIQKEPKLKVLLRQGREGPCFFPPRGLRAGQRLGAEPGPEKASQGGGGGGGGGRFFGRWFPGFCRFLCWSHQKWKNYVVKGKSSDLGF